MPLSTNLQETEKTEVHIKRQHRNLIIKIRKFIGKMTQFLHQIDVKGGRKWEKKDRRKHID